jgi:hypothetical protein
MPAITSSGLSVTYEVEQRDKDGSLLYREASVQMPELPEPPSPPTCYASECIEQYKRELDAWSAECKGVADFVNMVRKYHAARADYCRRHRHDEIEEKYRTGDPSPHSIEEARREIRKLLKE